MGATLGTRLYTWLRGELVGRDGQGNRYYRAKGGGRTHPDSLRREQRWVIYEGEAEANSGGHRIACDFRGTRHIGISGRVPRGHSCGVAGSVTPSASV